MRQSLTRNMSAKGIGLRARDGRHPRMDEHQVILGGGAQDLPPGFGDVAHELTEEIRRGLPSASRNVRLMLDEVRRHVAVERGPRLPIHQPERVELEHQPAIGFGGGVARLRPRGARAQQGADDEDQTEQPHGPHLPPSLAFRPAGDPP
jgi:hypothetical protein